MKKNKTTGICIKRNMENYYYKEEIDNLTEYQILSRTN